MDDTPKIIVHAEPQPIGRQAGQDNILQGLSGLFFGTEYEGLGNIAPMVKLIDGQHVINCLQEKNEEYVRETGGVETAKRRVATKIRNVERQF